MYKFYNSYNNSILLLENNITTIASAIRNKQRIEIFYNGGWRLIEVYAIGINTRGNAIIDAYQLSGSTNSRNAEFKTFLVNNIENVRITDQTFETPKPGWNPTSNKKFSSIELQIN